MNLDKRENEKIWIGTPCSRILTTSIQLRQQIFMKLLTMGQLNVKINVTIGSQPTLINSLATLISQFIL